MRAARCIHWTRCFYSWSGLTGAHTAGTCRPGDRTQSLHIASVAVGSALMSISQDSAGSSPGYYEAYYSSGIRSWPDVEAVEKLDVAYPSTGLRWKAVGAFVFVAQSMGSRSLSEHTALHCFHG